MSNQLQTEAAWTGWYRCRKGSPCDTIVLRSHRHPDGGRQKAGLLRGIDSMVQAVRERIGELTDLIPGWHNPGDYASTMVKHDNDPAN
jgi:hypothetical protein